MIRRTPLHAVVALSVLGIGPAGLGALSVADGAGAAPARAGIKYVRFQVGDSVSYGILEGDTVRRLSGDLFGTWEKTSQTYPLSSVKLLAPAKPSKVLALAGNYRSHLGGKEPKPNPELFFKSPTSVQDPEGAIVIPPGANNVHYEAELVIVIGKKAKNVSKADALSYVLGVTCGNDVSERDWQKNDVQWWRAKGCDTFGPIGPVIASGINYGDLLLTLRLNGEVKQQQRTSDLVHDVAAIVSFTSRHVTLQPGDLIFTGTPGETTAMKPGDVVEVEMEGVGVLRNYVRATQ